MNEPILFIEATSGISGDMLLGALLDLDVPVEAVSEAWDALGLDNFQVEISETSRSGMRALQCRVKTNEKAGPRTWKQFESILKKAMLKESIKADALGLTRKLFEMEAQIHGTSLTTLHLHEMGGTDLLIDVVGTLAALDALAPERIEASTVNTGRGFVTFSHGTYPVPAPVTSKILENVPVFQNEVEGELTTPTGALLLTHLAQSYGALPEMLLEKIGVGAGEREIDGHPNVVRIFRGRKFSGNAAEEIYMLESNIDDSSPQVLAYFMEKAFQQGALDVFFTSVMMKKNRPATRVSVLCTSSLLDTMSQLLFSETTAIGLRYWRVDRKKLDRRWKELLLEGWKVRIKESYMDGTLYNYQPEYDDCRFIAEKTKRPIKEIMAEAIHLYKSAGAKKSKRSKDSS